MRNRFLVAGLMALALFVAQNEPARGSESDASPVQPTATPQLHYETVLTTQGTVVSVDHSKSTISIRGSNGKTVELEARDAAQLDAISVGDQITVTYVEGAQIRHRNPGESLPMVSLKQGLIEAAPGSKPKSGHLRHLQMLAKVIRVDEQTQEVTLEGPDGTQETVMIENPESLSAVSSGDQIVITYYEAMVLAVRDDSKR